MALSTTLGVNFKANTQELLNGISQARRELKLNNSIYKEASSRAIEMSNATEALELKQGQLQDQLRIQNDLLKLQKDRLQLLTEKYGKNSKQVEEQTVVVNNQQATVNKLNKQLKDLGIELENVKRNYDENKESVEALTAKYDLAIAELAELEAAEQDHINTKDILNKKIEASALAREKEKRTLELLEAQLQDAIKEYGEGSVAVDKLKASVTRQRTALANSTKTLRDNKESLDDYEKETKEAAKHNTILGRSLEALKKHTKEAADAIGPLGEGFTVVKGAISHFVAHISASLFGTLKAMLSNARELRKELGMLQATALALELNTADLQNAEDSLRKIHSVTEDTAGATESLNNLLTAGFKSKSLDNITDLLLGASIKWKDTLSMEGLGDSIQEAIGSNGLSITGQFAELLERMGYNLEDWKGEFLALTTDAERQAKIAEALSKDNILKNTLAQYKEANKTLIGENEGIYDSLRESARLAEFFNPLIIEMRKGLNLLLAQLVDWLETLGGVEKAKEYIRRFFDEASKLFKLILDNAPLVVGALGSMTAAFVANKITTGIIGISNSIKEATVGMTGFKKVFSGTMSLLKTNIFSIIAIAVVALGAAMVHLYKNNEEFRNSVNKLFESIKPLLEKIWEAVQKLLPVIEKLVSVVLKSLGDILVTLIPIITDIVTELVELLIPIIEQIGPLLGELIPIISMIVEQLASLIVPLLQAIVPILQTLLPIIVSIAKEIMGLLIPVIQALGPILNGILQIVMVLVDVVMSKIKTLIEFVVAVFKTIKAIFTGNFSEIEGIWKTYGDNVSEIWDNLWKGLLDGLTSGFKKIWDGIVKFFDGIIEFVKEKFGIHSPSTVMAGFGKNIAEGLINGIKSMFGKIKGVITNIVDFFKEMPDKLKDIGKNLATGLWDGLKEKTQWLKNKITEFCSNIGKSITDFFQINSPSKWAAEQGGYIASGFGKGVLNGANLALKDVSGFNNKMAGSIGNITPTNNTTQSIDAGLTVNFNGTMSRKDLKRIENQHYKAVKMRLRNEGAI